MRRRAFSLVIALTAVTVVGAAVSLTMLYAGRMLQQRRHEQARSYAQIALDSGVAYVQAHRRELRANPPANAVVLPADALVAAPAKASISLRVQGATAVRLHAAVEIGNTHVSEEITVPLGE